MKDTYFKFLKTMNYMLKKNFLSLLLGIIIPTVSSAMLEHVENTIINAAEKTYDTFRDRFRVKDETLFGSPTPVEIIQFPFTTDTTFAQTHEIVKEIIRALAKKGLSLENVKKSKLYYKDINDALEALKILQTTYQPLFKKTTFHKWKGKMPDKKYKIFIEIKALAKQKRKKARL